MKKLALTSLILVGVLTGCAKPAPKGYVYTPDWNTGTVESAAGVPGSRKLGWDDGCASGEAAAGYIYSRFTKDYEKFNEDSSYAEAWRDAFTFCKGRMEAVQADVRSL